MADSFGDVTAAVRRWFDETRAAGWLAADADAAFARVEHATPADLFTDPAARPLVVALFGGTGVGKSSLLNRLAGSPLARAGVERPTSRAATLYVHQDAPLADLRAHLPLGEVTVARHARDDHRGIAWLDAPDIDSVEAHNRAVALAWLPHVDLVVYVVSPERYRDDVGWRVLQARGARHGWVFVINRWDEGDATQRADFAALLRQAGFTDPLVLCTSCLPASRDDDFDRLQSTVHELLAAHGLRELERLGHRARLRDLQRVLDDARAALGDGPRWTALRAQLGAHWSTTRNALADGLAWSAHTLAGRLEARATAPTARLGGRVAQALGVTAAPAAAPPVEPEAATPGELAYLVEPLWDEWAEQRLAAVVDAVEADARRAGITPEPLRAALVERFAPVAGAMRGALGDAVRLALARPGTPLQRGGRRVTGFLMTFLPLMAAGWVAVDLVRQYAGASLSGGQQRYPGTDFVLAGALLVGLAWFIPFWLDRLLRPSIGAAVQRAITARLADELDDLADDLDAVVERVQASAEGARAGAAALARQIDGLLVRPVRTDRPEIARVVLPTTADATS